MWQVLNLLPRYSDSGNVRSVRWVYYVQIGVLCLFYEGTFSTKSVLSTDLFTRRTRFVFKWKTFCFKRSLQASRESRIHGFALTTITVAYLVNKHHTMHIKSCLNFTGINTKRIEGMEMALKYDVLQEAARYNGNILLYNGFNMLNRRGSDMAIPILTLALFCSFFRHDEAADGSLFGVWTPVSADSVMILAACTNRHYIILLSCVYIFTRTGTYIT